MVKRAGTNSPITKNIGVDLPDYAAANWEGVMENTSRGFAAASQALDAQSQVFNQEYKRKTQEWQANEERKMREAQSGGNGLADVGNALAGIGKQMLAGYQLNEEVKLQRDKYDQALKQQEFENNLATAKFQQDQLQFRQRQDAEQMKAEAETLGKMFDEQLLANQAQINEIIATQGREQGFVAAKEQYESFIASPEFQALPSHVKYDVALKARKQLADITGESADKVFEERRKVADGMVQQAVQQYNLEYSAGIQRLRTAGNSLTPDEAQVLAGELLSGADALVANSESLKVVLQNPKQRIDYQSQIVKTVGEALSEYHKVTGTNQAEAANYVLASQQLRALEAFRDSGEINDAQYQTKAKEVLLTHGIHTDPDKMPTSSVQVLDARIENMKRRHEYSELIQRDRNLESVIGGETPKGQALKRRNMGVSLFNNINGNNVERRVAELRNLEKNSPEIAQAVDAAAERDLLEGYHTDRQKLTQYNQRTANLEAEIHKLGYEVNPPKAKEYTIDPNTPLGIGAGVAAKPEVVLIPAPNRVPQAPIEALQAKKDELGALYQERDVLMHKWQQYGVNLANPNDRQFLNKLEADTQAVADEVGRLTNERGISSDLDAGKLSKYTPTMSEVEYEKSKSGVYVDVLREKRNLTTWNGHAEGLGKHADMLRTEYDKAAKNVVQLVAMGQSDEALVWVNAHRGQLKKNAGLSANDTSLDSQLAKDESRLRELYEYAVNKKQWYSNKYRGESRPTTRPTPNPNFSKGNGRRPQPELPRNEGLNRPTMPMKGSLSVLPNVGMTPFKGGQVNLVPSGNSYGVKLKSTDSRVATVQGGTVIFTDTNTVLVKTPDGHTEALTFNGIKSVKKGDVLQPAQQVGNAKDGELGFEVWAGKAESPSAPNTDKGFTDPTAYLQRFQGKAELPVSGGTRNSQSPHSNYTGALKLSNDLVYFNGYIMDKNTLQMRRATPSDDVLLSRGVPLADTRTLPAQNFVTPNRGGGKTVTYYEPPAESKTKQHYLFVKPAGYNDKQGNPVYYVEGYEKGRRVFSRPVTQGATGSRRPARHGIVSPLENAVVPDNQGRFKYGSNNFTYKTRGEARRPDGVHKGIDMFAPRGSAVKAPLSGTVVYAELGHTRVNSPKGDNYSVLIKLDKPITQNGKTVDHVYMTHLKSTNVQAGQKIGAGTVVAESGFANEDHLHIGFVNRDQSVWLNEGEMYELMFEGQQGTVGIPDGSYKVDKTGASVTGNMNFYNPADKSLVNNFIRRRNGTSMYVSSVPKQQMVASGINDHTGRPMEVGGLSIFKEDYAESNPEDDYGIPQLQKDPRLKAAYHKAAKQIGIPTVWLIDQTLGESGDGLNKAIKGGTGGNYYGLIQMGHAALHDVGMLLEGKPFTPDTLRQRDIYWQVETMIPAYYKVQENIAKRSGYWKGIQTYEDLLVLVWGGAGAYSRNQQRRRGLNDGFVNWDEYRDKIVGGSRKHGRSYNWSHKRTTTIHANPRDNCPVCASMLRGGNFTSHYYYG